jgi:hypothetical protein
MRESRFELEMRAYKSLQGLMEAARETERLFRLAGLPVPLTLLRLFGDADVNGDGQDRRSAIPPMKSPDRPPEATSDWIWVEASELLTTNLILSILRVEGGGPKRPQELHQLSLAYKPESNVVSIFNAGSRIEGRLIRKDDNGWVLIDPAKVPILRKGFAWGPSEIFAAQEVASYRRAVVRHLLETSAGGLMTMQVVESLRNANEYKFPVTKELIQDDLEAMQGAGRVKRVTNSRKWIPA